MFPISSHYIFYLYCNIVYPMFDYGFNFLNNLLPFGIQTQKTLKVRLNSYKGGMLILSHVTTLGIAMFLMFSINLVGLISTANRLNILHKS